MRPFPRPWSAEETDACFIVRDKNRRLLMTLGSQSTHARRGAAHGSGVVGYNAPAMLGAAYHDHFSR